TLINEEHGLYTAPKCNVGAGQKEGKPESTVIGENLVETVIEPTPGVFADAELKGTVYNLVPERIPTSTKALSSLFGVAIKVAEPVPGFGLYAHTFIEGNVEWGAEATGTGRADYHDYFEIKNITPGLLRSRLSFEGNIGHIGFLTNPTSCTGPGPQTTTRWHGESYEGVTATAEYTTPIGTEGCNGEESFVKPP